MNIVLTSTALVALAEMGDKTQLLAILLATNVGLLIWRLGIRIAVAIGFIAMGLWTLVPDKIDDDELKAPSNAGVFLSTTIAFFLVEMGDKTQIATVALGAQFGANLTDVALVTLGTTLGMMLANVPAVLLGEALVKRVPLKLMRAIAAALFVGLGLWMLGGVLGWF